MPFHITVPAQAEPLTIAEVKAQIPWDPLDTTWDLWFQSAITASRQFGENKTQKVFVTSTVEQVLDSFPGGMPSYVPFGRAFTMPENAILLDVAPVQSVTSVVYMDMSGTWQTMDPTTWVAEIVSEPARITPVFGSIWPIPRPQIGSVKVTYIAGYGDATTVPEGLKAWMKMRIGAMFQNREEISVGTRLTVNELPFVDGMLDNFRVPRF